MVLDSLSSNTKVRIADVDWTRFPDAECRRLRALGIDVGEEVTIRQRGVFFGRDPIALEIGRVTVAIRRKHALAINVEPVADTAL
jgi:ferrous iron transport protein A